MSKSAIRTMSEVIRKSAFILPPFMFITGLMFVTLVRMGIDFWTNIDVVTDMNVRSFDTLFFHILNLGTLAMLPQFVPVVAFYIGLAMQPKSKTEEYLRIAIIVVGVGVTILDVWFGYVWYEKDGHSHPLLMAGVIDVLFSEIAWAILFGLFIELKSDAWRETKRLFGMGTYQARPNKQPQQNRQPKQKQPRKKKGGPSPQQQRPPQPKQFWGVPPQGDLIISQEKNNESN